MKKLLLTAAALVALTSAAQAAFQAGHFAQSSSASRFIAIGSAVSPVQTL
jgi:hypothetical protein